MVLSSDFQLRKEKEFQLCVECNQIETSATFLTLKFKTNRGLLAIVLSRLAPFRLHGFFSSSDWFVELFTFVVIS